MTTSCDHQSFQDVLLFPEGNGYTFVDKLSVTAYNKLYIVQSLSDNSLCVRKESLRKPYEDDLTVQSNEVRIARSLQHCPGVAKLLGWVEYHDSEKIETVNVSYWKLYHGDTLENAFRAAHETDRKIPERCLLSVFGQMLRTMLDTIAAGILHIDAHEENWVVDFDSGADAPQMVLIDWGRVEERCDESMNADKVERWWNSAHSQISTFIVGAIRELMLLGCPTPFEHIKMEDGERVIEGGRTKKEREDLRTHFDRILKHSEDRGKHCVSLIALLNQVEDTSPAIYQSGEEWFREMDHLYIQIISTRFISSTDSKIPLPHASLTQYRDIAIPSFQEALQYINQVDAEILGRGSKDTGKQLIHLWYPAQIHTTTNEIAHIDKRPSGFSCHGFHDSTNSGDLPVVWREAHEQMREVLLGFDASEEVETDMVREDYNTAVPGLGMTVTVSRDWIQRGHVERDTAEEIENTG